MNVCPIRKEARWFSARNLVEHCFNKLQQCRRVATRYEKLAANDPAVIQLAVRGNQTVVACC